MALDTEAESREKNNDFFALEKKGIQKGTRGGLAMMAIAVVWFVVGYAAGVIFYYPPILFIIGLYALLKSIYDEDISEFTCSDCNTPVKAEDKICPGCGAKLEDEEEEKDEFTCSDCNTPVKAEDKICPGCGVVLED